MTYDYPGLAKTAIDRLLKDQLKSVDAAADLVAAALLDDGVLQAFGTGHARLIVHELAGRAGGLIPVNLVRLQDVVFFGDRSPASILDPTLERDPGLAAEVLELAAPRPGDPWLIASNSGINGSVVELARLVREAGHPVIAVCSLAHSRTVPSRHPSGLRLPDLADLVIDNGAPPGDAALELPDGTRVGALSNLVGVVIVQLLTEGVARRMLAAGVTPPVYRSMNLPDGDRANAARLAAYGSRIRPIEP
ncbi:sugar isomerase domain-containing protein [Microlunatus parietis]|uniref:Putative phosphosugar-binding protein n=1 Tax=Microlunatus parietis TaxID=682979 RepID=A0A7Y9I9W4_9ACTN|nr:sugar isomerase domain-containing protein [Microlunatus parietis]NYE72882.1 putative phosphosugar-binding protein [Microlunatus parietis]